MIVTDIPFNKFIGIKKSDLSDYILMTEDSQNYANHLGTVHASVQFALAEATSGEFLLNKFKEYSENTVPVIRKAELKYSKPAKGKLYSKAEISIENEEKLKKDLKEKGRTIIEVAVSIYDINKIKTLQGSYEWFIQIYKKD